jgi:HAD superfamily hydrolase (TIGR01509 family)
MIMAPAGRRSGGYGTPRTALRGWPRSERSRLIELDITTIGAVLFDMDGTIVDTEPLWYEAEVRLVAGYGGELGPDHAARLLGKPIEYSAAYLREVGGIDLDAATLGDQLNTQMVKLLSEGVTWRPGARELLDALVAAGVRRGLVSASHRQIIDAVLTNIAETRFEVIVGHDDVTSTKPDPEPYLLAARHLGLDPADCVVFEDSATGVASAVAAGCRVVLVPGRIPVDPGPGVTVIRSLADVRLVSGERQAPKPA